ncbi:MAG: FtsX-like permease family protein [Oscillospiraceae bacterium]
MKNPLTKRLPREFFKDATKYIAIFIMMVFLIAICSGMRVANESLKVSYYESFELYNIEDGHITFDKNLPDELKETFENDIGIKLYNNFYFDEDTSETGATVRIYKQSDELNKPCLLSGELPSQDNEIAIDRVFAKNNSINIGDIITLNGKKLEITGFIALPNYSTLFENNTDSMFDSINFSVAVMTDSGFDSVGSKNINYNYAWVYNESCTDDIESAERSDKFLDLLEDEITDYDGTIVQEQIDYITNRLEKASEEYADIYKASFEKKIESITDTIEKGAEEYASLYMETGQKPTKNDLSIDTDDFTFEIIENSVSAMLTGTEYTEPSEQDFLNEYIGYVEKPKKEELSIQLDDFLFGIIEDAVSAEINGEDYTMPEDEAFEDEIDKTDIISVEDYIPRYLNQAITFSIEDIGGDEAGTMVMCYMMIGILAFIFAVTISNTIVSESGVIGTLRASGYTKGELIRHYMILPIIITLISAVVGNVIGYTVMKDFCANLYLNSYSLTTYKTLWNPSAFLISTVVPICLMLLINLTVLISKLELSPLKFLRHDLKKNRNKKAMRLNTKIPFKTRFSLRIFFTNLAGYIVMIIGILFGAVLISFGDMFPRMLDSYRDIIIHDMISEYQYVLYDCEVSNEVTDIQAEKYASSSFDYSKEGYLTDSITVYGIEHNSCYIHEGIPNGKVLISTGISEKFGLNIGDTIKLDEKYKRDSSYVMEIGGIYDYQSSLAIFMNIDDYNITFGEKSSYFTGYFSNNELTELDNDDIAVDITASDYTKLSDQLTVSMGGMMDIYKWFGAMFFVIVVYVLCKQVIERNFQSIAMTKILGFRNSEISSLYIASTSIAVLFGLIISIPFIDIVMRAIFKGYLYTMMTGYIPYVVSPITYIITISTGLICYVVVALLQMRKVSKISKSEALKNVE